MDIPRQLSFNHAFRFESTGNFQGRKEQLFPEFPEKNRPPHDVDPTCFFGFLFWFLVGIETMNAKEACNRFDNVTKSHLKFLFPILRCNHIQFRDRFGKEMAFEYYKIHT